MKAALYARVSTEDQAREEKASLETQTSDIEKYCGGKGYQLVKPYYIDVQSGSDTMKNRLQFEKMLEDAEKELFDVIVAWQPDRLFRSMWPAARLKRTIDETGIDVEAVKQPLDKKMLGLWAWLAEMEIENLRERSRMGKCGVARKGLIVMKDVPYGYQIGEDRRPQINEAEAYVVRRIFQEFVLENKPTKWIANDLNAQNVPLRTGKAKFGWSTTYIYTILRNRTYIGKGVYGAYRHSGKKCRKQPEDEQIPVPFPPIIDEDLFQAAQDKKADRLGKVERHYPAFHLVRDLAYCRECGYKLIPRDEWKHTQRRKSGKIYVHYYKKPLRYYKCYGMFRYPDRFTCRKPGYIKTSELDNLVWQKVTEIVRNPALITEGTKGLQGQGPGVGLAEELESAKQRVSDLSWQKQRAISLQVRELITEEDLAIQLKFIQEKLQYFEAEVKRLSKEIDKTRKKEINLASIEQLSKQIKDRLDDLTEEEQIELVRLLVHRVWVDGKWQVEIEFAIPEVFTPYAATSIPESIPALSYRGGGQFVRGDGGAGGGDYRLRGAVYN